ncbi:MAG: pantetheine-phosphate adenylyltransferase [Clostridia bacterium]
MSKVIFPGSFDPFTVAHADILFRAAKLFDKIYVAILNNDAKKPFFSLKERETFIAKTLGELKNIEILSFSGLLVDIYQRLNADAVLRGLRDSRDYLYECDMAAANKHLYPNIDVIFLQSRTELAYISSSLVKSIGTFGGSLSGLVPDVNINYISGRLKNDE